MFCVAPKTGTTSLESYLLNNINDDDRLSWQTSWLAESNPHRRELINNGLSTKVMFIRHPQDRIASAYNMLFGKSQDYAYDFNEARTLILKAITNITNSGTQDGLSFPKFVNFLYYGYQKKYNYSFKILN